MSIASGVVTFTRIIDGDVITTHMYSTEILVQRLKAGTNTPLPDWNIAVNQPTIFPRAISQNTGNRIKIHSPKWYYNGVEILSGNPTFFTGTHDDGGVVVPSLTIVRNLASINNLDSDTIRFEGKATIAGVEYNVSSSIEIRIEEMVGEPYDGIIKATEGGVIDNDTPEVTATALLYKGGVQISSGVTYKWFRVGKSGDTELTPPTSTPNKMTFKDDDIDSELTIRVDFYYNGTKVYSATRLLSDETDPYYLEVSMNGPVDLRDGEEVYIKPNVKDRATGKVVTGYNFEFVFMNNLHEVQFTHKENYYTLKSSILEKYGNLLNMIIYATK